MLGYCEGKRPVSGPFHQQTNRDTIMTTVSIVYHSGAGHTAQMAEAVAQGARTVAGTQVSLLRIQGSDLVEGRFKNEALLA